MPDEVDDLPHTAVLPLLAGKRRLLESAVNNGGVLADMHVCVGTITMARNWAHRNINGCAMVSADVIISCLVECPDACNWVRKSKLVLELGHHILGCCRVVVGNSTPLVAWHGLVPPAARSLLCRLGVQERLAFGRVHLRFCSPFPLCRRYEQLSRLPRTLCSTTEHVSLLGFVTPGQPSLQCGQRIQGRVLTPREATEAPTQRSRSPLSPTEVTELATVRLFLILSALRCSLRPGFCIVCDFAHARPIMLQHSTSFCATCNGIVL